MTAKAAELQREVRENAEEYQNYLKDLYSWESDIKSKDEALKNSPKPPIEEFPIRNKKAVSMCSENSSTSSIKVELTDHQNKQKAVIEKNKGNEWFKEGKYMEAIDCYTKAINLDPADAILPANRAIALIKLSRFEEAEEDCNRSLKLDPTFVKAYHRRGTARSHTGKIDQAISDFQKVLSIEPHNKAAQQELDKLLSSPDKSSAKSSKSEENKEALVSKTKRVSFDQSIASTKNSIEVTEKGDGKKRSEILDLSLNHPSLMHVEEFVPTLNAIKKESKVHIPVVQVNDHKQERLGVDKFINQLSSNKMEIDVQPVTQPVICNLPPIPKNYIQFDQDWTRLKDHRDLRYKYLKQIDPSKLSEIFRESLESNVLGDILGVLKTEFAERKESVLPWLLGLAQVKRINAVTLFLSQEHKQDFDFLFKYVINLSEGTEEERNLILRKFS